jgi:hypothetical protein
VWAAAFREQSAPPTPAQFARYRTLLGAYAKEPMPWRRRAMYQLGRLICGLRPFAPYLQRERFETELQINQQCAAA